MMNQEILSQQLRARRQSLTLAQQEQARKKIAETVHHLPVFVNSEHIGVYLTNDGEVDPTDIVLAARQLNKQCYLPVIDQPNKGDMYFLPFTEDTPLAKNCYGIAEPSVSTDRVFYAQDLDLVLLPLTGFDEQGRRMGMGGGYYDRALSFKKQYESRKPALIGLAHECQKVPQLPVNPWDIAVDHIVTDQRIY